METDHEILGIWNMLSVEEMAIILKGRPDGVVPRVLKNRTERIAEARAWKPSELLPEIPREMPFAPISAKRFRRVVRVVKGKTDRIFPNQYKVAEYLKVAPTWVSRCIQQGKPIHGFRVELVEPHCESNERPKLIEKERAA